MAHWPGTLGIGIITYNRLEMLKTCVQRILSNTDGPLALVIADDGSTDGTPEWCEEQGHYTITGKNRGVCWNKNRALYTLLEHSPADQIILLEDDCWPNTPGWADSWTQCTKEFQHVNYRLPESVGLWAKNWCVGGNGTPEDPWLSFEITGQCTASTREALEQVGYLNTKFRGYGYGHIEWTRRFARARLVERDRYPCLDYGLEFAPSKSGKNLADILHNRDVYRVIDRDPQVYCAPWQDVKEEDALKVEVQRASDRSLIRTGEKLNE